MSENQAEYKVINQWGGKRKGAGPKRKLTGARAVTVYLDAETIHYLEAQSATISAAIRLIIKQRMDSAPRSLADIIQPAEAQPEGAI